TSEPMPFEAVELSGAEGRVLTLDDLWADACYSEGVTFTFGLGCEARLVLQPQLQTSEVSRTVPLSPVAVHERQESKTLGERPETAAESGREPKSTSSLARIRSDHGRVEGVTPPAPIGIFDNIKKELSDFSNEVIISTIKTIRAVIEEEVKK